MTDQWQMKTKHPCYACGGTGLLESGNCPECNGAGTFMHKVSPPDIETFLERPDKAEFTCVCKKVESILRPTQGQIPSGWLNWDGDYVCNNCKYLIMFAALNAAAQKVQQLKEKKNA